MTTISLDETLEILSASRRRDTLAALQTVDEQPPVDIAVIVNKILEIEESRKENDEKATYLRNSIYNTSVQNHFPILDDAGVIDFDMNGYAKTIEPGEHFDLIVGVLEAAQDAYQKHAGGQ